MHNTDIYCITVSLISGVQLSKTRNFDVLPDGSFGFHGSFVPFPRMRQETLEKPVVHQTKTYFIGFDPERLARVAEITKRDLEEAFRCEIARLNTMSSKMAFDWNNLAKTVTQEMQLINANALTSPAGAKVAQNPIEDKPGDCGVIAPKSPPATTEPPPTLSSSSTGKNVLPYSVHLAGARGTSNPKIEASGFFGRVKNLQSGEVSELCDAGDCSNVTRTELVALKTVLEDYPFPISSPTQECLISIYTPTEYLANMFNWGLLKRYSTNGWKKKDGSHPKNLDLLQKIWERAQNFTVKGVQISSEDATHIYCVERAQEAGAKFYQTSYSLIPPGGKQGGSH